MRLTSTAFEPMAEIPTRYTCEGEDRSPPLGWDQVPEGCASLALIVHDPDIPDAVAPKRIWVHWVLYDLPPETRQLGEGAMPPATTRQGLNDWKKTGYGGPCPPRGRHRYFFRLYALDVKLGALAKADKNTVEKAMQGHILAMAELVGTYQKKG